MSLPYYRWFPGDYIRDTRRLSMLQHGAYRLLLDEYMVTGKPLPNDLPALYRICGAVSGEEHSAIRYVLEEFFRLDGPVWKHKRCDDELSRQSERAASARDSAGKRWGKKTGGADAGAHANAYANALPTDSDGNASQNHVQNQMSIPNGIDTEQRAQETPAALCVAFKKAGINVGPGNVTVMEMARQGVTVETLQEAITEAKRAKGTASFGVNYVASILTRWATERRSLQFAGAAPPSRTPPVTALERQADVLAAMTGGFHGRPTNEPETFDADHIESPRLAIGRR